MGMPIDGIPPMLDSPHVYEKTCTNSDDNALITPVRQAPCPRSRHKSLFTSRGGIPDPAPRNTGSPDLCFVQRPVPVRIPDLGLRTCFDCVRTHPKHTPFHPQNTGERHTYFPGKHGKTH